MIKLYEGRTLEHLVKDVYFDQSDHKYFHLLKEGGLLEIPGVSHVLETIGVSDHSNIPRRILEAAGKRGTAVHRGTHLDDLGELDERTIGNIRGYIDAYRSWRDREKPVFVAREEPMYDSHFDVCGTVDIVARLPRQLSPRREDVIDIKSGKEYGWHVYQLAGYLIIRYGAKWASHGMWNLYLRSNGTYDFRPIPINVQMAAAADWVRLVRSYNEKRHSLFGRRTQ